MRIQPLLSFFSVLLIFILFVPFVFAGVDTNRWDVVLIGLGFLAAGTWHGYICLFKP